MRNFILAIVITTLLGCNHVTDAQTYGEVVSVEQFEEKIESDDVQLIDVRTPQEYADGHIADAVNMDVKDSAEFLENIESLDKSQPVYLYCRSGKRSQKAAQILEEKGFDTIVDLDGGYLAWEKKHP